jgi:hypothetical protein
VTVSLRTWRARAVLSLGALPLAASGLGACAPPGGGGGGGGGGAAACAPVEVLAARGTTEPQSGSFIMGGLSSGIASRTGGRVYQVVYPAAISQNFTPGVTDALRRINECETSKIVLNGYSQGAMLMVSVIRSRELSADAKSRIKAVVLYGNPFFNADSPAAAGSGKAGSNRHGSFSDIPADFVGKTRDYCNAGDPVCGGGGTGSGHLGYASYHADGINFAVNKVNGD